ncbi:MAG: cytochrome c [Vicinamibacterales bacterium]
MKSTVAVVMTLGTIFAATMGVMQAQEKRRGYTTDPRITAYDRGPAKINVSKYPPEMKEAYKVFANRCAACHTLARPVNCEYVLDEEWQRYIRQMMDKGGSLISPEEAKSIFEFVTYDSRTRKKELYEKKLAASK